MKPFIIELGTVDREKLDQLAQLTERSRAGVLRYLIRSEYARLRARKASQDHSSENEDASHE
jgi:hypothetical protein